MQKKKAARMPRIISWFLALSMAAGMLPVQAGAVKRSDPPETWPDPDSRYTAPGEEPVYLFLDYSDENDGGIRAHHTCLQGAQFISDIVPATATRGGHVKYTCDTCGGWAQIDVPALPLSAFTLDPAYQSVMDNGVEFSGQPYTVVYDVAPAYQRYVGKTLNNNVSVSEVGLYGIVIEVDSDIYDNVQHRTAEDLLVYAKAVPWTTEFESKIYDGKSLLTGKTASYTDVRGNTIQVPLSAYQVKAENGELEVDDTKPVSNPVAAGPYGISATITDKNYV